MTPPISLADLEPIDQAPPSRRAPEPSAKAIRLSDLQPVDPSPAPTGRVSLSDLEPITTPPASASPPAPGPPSIQTPAATPGAVAAGPTSAAVDPGGYHPTAPLPETDHPPLPAQKLGTGPGPISADDLEPVRAAPAFGTPEWFRDNKDLVHQQMAQQQIENPTGYIEPVKVDTALIKKRDAAQAATAKRWEDAGMTSDKEDRFTDVVPEHVEVFTKAIKDAGGYDLWAQTPPEERRIRFDTAAAEMGHRPMVPWTRDASVAWNETSFKNNTMPFGGIEGTIDLAQVYLASQRLNNGTGTEEDERAVLEFTVKSEIEGLRESTTMGMALDLTARLPQFIGEIAATAPLFAGGKKLGTEAVNQTVGKAVRRMIEKTTRRRAEQRAAGTLVAGAAERKVKAAVRSEVVARGVTGAVVGSGVQSLGMPHRTLENYYQRRIDVYGVQEDGSVKLIKNGEDLSAAAWKAPVDTWIELASEQAGGAVPILAKGIPGSAKVKAAKDALARWLKINPSKGTKDFMQAVANRTAFNGPLPEIGEEELGKLMRTAILGDPYKTTTGTELKAQALAFSVPSVLGVGLSATDNYLTRKQEAAREAYTPTPTDEAEPSDDLTRKLTDLGYTPATIQAMTPENVEKALAAAEPTPQDVAEPTPAPGPTAPTPATAGAPAASEGGGIKNDPVIASGVKTGVRDTQQPDAGDGPRVQAEQEEVSQEEGGTEGGFVREVERTIAALNEQAETGRQQAIKAWVGRTPRDVKEIDADMGGAREDLSAAIKRLDRQKVKFESEKYQRLYDKIVSPVNDRVEALYQERAASEDRSSHSAQPAKPVTQQPEPTAKATEPALKQPWEMSRGVRTSLQEAALNNESLKQLTRDDVINPKVFAAVIELQRRGIDTTLSGDLYGKPLVYIDLKSDTGAAAARADLPDGWHVVPALADRTEENLRRAAAGETVPAGWRLARTNEGPGVTWQEARLLADIIARKSATEEDFTDTKTPVSAGGPNIRHGGSTNDPNRVYAMIRDRDGETLGFASVAYDGSEGDATDKSKQLRSSIEGLYPDLSQVQTLTGSTDSEGRAKYAISPNSKHVAEAGSREARYIGGDLSARPTPTNAIEAAMLEELGTAESPSPPTEPAPKQPWEMAKGDFASSDPQVVKAKKKLESAREALGGGNRWGESRRFQGSAAGNRLAASDKAAKRWSQLYDRAEAKHRKAVEQAIKRGDIDSHPDYPELKKSSTGAIPRGTIKPTEPTDETQNSGQQPLSTDDGRREAAQPAAIQGRGDEATQRVPTPAETDLQGPSKPPSRVEYQRRLIRQAQDNLGLDVARFDPESADLAAGGRGDNFEFSTGFAHTIPQDLADALQGKTHLLRMLTMNQPGARGQDAMAMMGVDGYVKALESMHRSDLTGSMELARGATDFDPAAAFYAHLLDNWPRAKSKGRKAGERKDKRGRPLKARSSEDGPRIRSVTRPAEQLQAGDQLTIFDESYTVSEDNGYKELLNADGELVTYLEALEDMPVDIGSLRRGGVEANTSGPQMGLPGVGPDGAMDGPVTGKQAGSLFQAEPDRSGADESEERFRRSQTPQDNETGDLLVQTPTASKSPKHKFSSTQVNLPDNLARQVQEVAAQIPDTDLAIEGREAQPHITVKYGLKTDNIQDVRRVLDGLPPVRLTLGKTSLFENDEHDVVKVDVTGPGLHVLNRKLSEAIDHEDTHPTYKPHLTLAYVKKGRGKTYAGNEALKGVTITLDEVVFSGRDGKQTAITLKKTAKASGSIKGAEQSAIERIQKRAAGKPAPAIRDFGEKIGGARKDTATRTGPKAPRLTPAEKSPPWMRGYGVAKDARTEKWFAYQGKTPINLNYGSMAQEFVTREDAIQALPRMIVQKRHRISRQGEAYAIYREISRRKHPVIKGGFETYEEAKAYLEANAEEILSHKFDQPERPWLDSVEREGPRRREGDVIPEKFQEVFGFRGGEFGNWNIGGDGQAALNHAYDALLDLADTLGMPARAMSLDGELAIAFGARGHGGKQSVSAHYEPARGVINLTKIKGAGSLAHEWFHALDHFIARKAGHTSDTRGPEGTYALGKGRASYFISHGFGYQAQVNQDIKDAFNHVMRTVSRKEQTTKVQAGNHEQREDRHRKDLVYRLNELKDTLTSETQKTYNKRYKPPTPAMLKEWDALAEKIKAGDVGEKLLIEGPKRGRRSSNYRESYQPIEDLNKIYKAVTNRSFTGMTETNPGKHLLWEVQSMLRTRERVEAAGRGDTETRGVATDYLENARDIDRRRTSDYWSTPHEMGARAFESFMFDTIKSSGNRSDYLVHGVTNDHYAPYNMKPYPEGAEREEINRAFGKLFDEIGKDAEGSPATTLAERIRAIGDAAEKRLRERQLDPTSDPRVRGGSTIPQDLIDLAIIAAARAAQAGIVGGQQLARIVTETIREIAPQYANKDRVVLAQATKIIRAAKQEDGSISEEGFERVSDEMIRPRGSKAPAPASPDVAAGTSAPWPKGFPRIVTHAPLEKLYAAGSRDVSGLDEQGKSRAYHQAKSGDIASAIEVVTALVDPEVLDQIGRDHPGAIVVSVHAQEAAGRNKLPQAYAEAVGQIGRLRVDHQIVQTNLTSHTGANQRQRLVRVPEFDGTVQAGRDYIIVDDVATSGASLAPLRHYIEAKGGRVVLASTLSSAAARYGMDPQNLAIQPDTIEKIDSKFGIELTDGILNKYGIAPSTSHLSDGQGHAVLRYASVDAFRSSVAAPRQASGSPAGQGQVSAPSQEVDGQASDPLIDNPPPRIQKAHLPSEPSGLAPGKPAAWMQDAPKAQTKAGRRLLSMIERDPDGKHVGMRSIIAMLMDQLKIELRVGSEQLGTKTPGSADVSARMVRSLTGTLQSDIHEAGHVIGHMLEEAEPGLIDHLGPTLIQIASMKGSFASGRWQENEAGQKVFHTTPGEGFAEWVRRYVWNPRGLPAEVTSRFEAVLTTYRPDVLATLRDAARAVQAHAARSPRAVLRSLSTDEAPALGWRHQLQNIWHWTLFKGFSAEAALETRVRRPVWRAISKVSTDDARRFEASTEDTSADYRNAYQMTYTVPTESAEALTGKGIRIQKVGGGLLDSVLEQASDETQVELMGLLDLSKLSQPAKHGEYVYLTDYSVKDIIEAVGNDQWTSFETYGWMRTALDRWEKDEQVYPGYSEGLTPGVLRREIAAFEKDHDHFSREYERLNRFMDQMLLASLVSGEFTPEQVVAITGKYESYWPLPKNAGVRLEAQALPGGPGGAGGAGSGLGNTDPSSGVMRAYGGEQGFLSILDAVERRATQALKAYYQNAVMRSILDMQTQIDQTDLPGEVKADVHRLMTPLEMDWKLVATLQPHEKRAAVAEHLNALAAESKGVEPADLDARDAINPDDIEIVEPGESINVWRKERPKAVRVIAPNIDGERRFFQINDPILFEFFARTAQPGKTLKFFTDMAAGVNLSRREALTQNVPFAIRAAFRDLPTSMLFGETWQRYLPGAFHAMGIMNRITGKMPDAKEVGELYSRVIKAVNLKQHVEDVTTFKEIVGTSREQPMTATHQLIDKTLSPGWAKKGLMERVRDLPGAIMDKALLPLKWVNTITGGFHLSQFMESIHREGQFVALRNQGKSTARARAGAMRIGGNFSARPGSATVGEVYRFGLFVNAAQQINWQLWRGLTDVDRKKMAASWTALSASSVTLGMMLSALAYLMMGDDERKQRQDAPDEERMAWMWVPIPGTDKHLKLPHDYGAPGAMTAMGSWMMERYLYERGVDGKTAATTALKRLWSLPAVVDLMTPELRTLVELKLNHSFFTSRSVVPEWMVREYPDAPDLQSYTDTPGWAMTVGEKLGMSPIKVQYALRQLFTHQYADLVESTRRVAEMDLPKEANDVPFAGRLVVREPRGWRSQPLIDLSKLDMSLKEARQRLERLEDRNDPRLAQEIDKQNDLIDQLEPHGDAMKDIRDIWSDVKAERGAEEPDLEYIKQLEREMTDVARQHLERHKAD